MGDHAECVELDFDPNEISYHKLLEKFFQWHNAFRKPYARQYMSAILLHNQEQRQAVEMILPQIEDKKRKVRSEIADYHGFTWAEDYHQKYYLRRSREVVRELKQRYPSLEELVNSTAAARANAALAGFWSPTPEALIELGFSSQVSNVLLNRPKSFFGSLLSSVFPKATSE